MDKKIFEVEISSGGPESYKTSAVLAMPCTQAELCDALQKARQEGPASIRIAAFKAAAVILQSSRVRPACGRFIRYIQLGLQSGFLCREIVDSLGDGGYRDGTDLI